MNASPLKVLIVDDHNAVVESLRILLEVHGLEAVCTTDPDEACRIAASQALGAVIQDMNFEPNETSGDAGVALFRSLREIDEKLPVLLMTAWASVESAVALMKEGASDYLEKPWNDAHLITTLKNLVKIRELEVENTRLRTIDSEAQEALARNYDLCGIVFRSSKMRQVISLAINVADSNAPVLITGPSGSGKERLAEIIHANSRRCKKTLARINVGAVPNELIESELFGAEQGAYTGLNHRRLGFFESTDEGTLFLDEIDSLSLDGQVKLLRVVQSGEFVRLGSSQPRCVDVRIISATNANLKEAIANGRFREDLFFRLNVIEIQLPGLAERPDDILPLAEFFLERYIKDEKRAPKTLSEETKQALLEYSWPGNVRELENRLHRAFLVATGEEIQSHDLGLEETSAAVPSDNPRIETKGAAGKEEQEILDALGAAQGIVAHAAQNLGLSRQALYRKMARLGISVERKSTHS